ncbi:MAG: S-adenosylmethionine:tRNA ribosyltransferase-isomerase, partial [candidate division KSB1 bacterium]|nr:S-adenosylmethionine:tRNA ribosyltransferase-isomerase [candidate division KSB1 bacterium]
MKLSDFKYTLPEELIAQYPAEKRDQSRLMVLNRKDKSIEHKQFYEIIDYMNPGDGLVINETKVFPARLMGTKDKTDARVEVFLLRELENGLWEVLVKPARKVRVGNRLTIGPDLVCDVIDNTVSGGRVVRFNYQGDFYELVEKIGKAPLPPYIKREPEPLDKERYQTVYARVRGAVAAPTRGLAIAPFSCFRLLIDDMPRIERRQSEFRVDYFLDGRRLADSYKIEIRTSLASSGWMAGRFLWDGSVDTDPWFSTA